MTDYAYQPSSSEKKTVILIYLLIGSMLVLHKDRMSARVRGHLHQALGRRIIFVIIALISLILVFIPILSLVPVFVLLVIIGIWGWFIYQTRAGVPAQVAGGLALFASIGKRMTDVMDIHPLLENTDHQTQQTESI